MCEMKGLHIPKEIARLSRRGLNTLFVKKKEVFH